VSVANECQKGGELSQHIVKEKKEEIISKVQAGEQIADLGPNDRSAQERVSLTRSLRNRERL
jgi:hypothetical protein